MPVLPLNSSTNISTVQPRFFASREKSLYVTSVILRLLLLQGSVAVSLAIIQVGKNLVEALRWPFDPLKSNVSTCCQFQREKLRQFFKPWMHVPAIRRSDDKAFLFYVLQDQH